MRKQTSFEMGDFLLKDMCPFFEEGDILLKNAFSTFEKGLLGKSP
jgi:hypothetical protein